MSDKNMRHGSAHWPAVPPEPPREDGTAGDTSRTEMEYSPPGRGWRLAVLVALIVVVFVGMVGAVLMFLPGGGR